MPNSRNNRQQGQEEKGRMGKLPEKAASFHGRNQATQAILRRPKTETDLLSGRKLTLVLPETTPKLTKLLLNVTIERSLGAIHVVISPESTVGDLVAAAIRQYEKEGRRPLLQTDDLSQFDLHYSQFSLESLNREEKLINLGSRNFFMCRRKEVDGAGVTTTRTSSCSNQAEKASKIAFPWLRIFFA
ncbi:hypothetical protein AQUCO_01900030v1 [Aquilegia coerulea]|uniref:DUF7054 domain-containing protein n=1 Tax=Aquilegia coerulea TaxID=218851 RepID=A0A2G5DIN3_AQUCA|nr:hypothetical protein AQUCO_01900030v1 [Aquilegia coerulea]